MAVDRGDVWWLPALYLQRSELESGAEREATVLSGADAGADTAKPRARAADSFVLCRGLAQIDAERLAEAGLSIVVAAERFRERFANAGFHKLSSKEESL